MFLSGSLTPSSGAETFGAGGFVKPTLDTELTLSLVQGDECIAMKRFDIGPRWSRFGVAGSASPSEPVVMRIAWSSGADLNVWGINAGPVAFPASLVGEEPDSATLSQDHLAPETFYLDHDAATFLEFMPDLSSEIALDDGEEISVKKCSYCGRHLPLDMTRIGGLSFHKHNAKKTNHQNECRSCKKWRINNQFNPIRTTDQLHESSVITRERAIFLRDPQILQEIKDRSGAGLKSQVWERFGRRCFYCDRELQLSEVQLDHTRPLAYLWPIDEHATCLCAEHNNLKKDKFPVDFYSADKLEQLSEITGLALADLSRKELNDRELQRILGDITTFAREWDPRHFAATARKIAELRPEVDLFESLKNADPGAAAELQARLAERPPSVGEEFLA